jgi:hypothetical protein
MMVITGGSVSGTVSANNSSGSVPTWPPPGVTIGGHRIVTSSSDAARPVSTSGVDVRTGYTTPHGGAAAVGGGIGHHVASFSGVGGWVRAPGTPPDTKHDDKRLFMEEGKGLRVIIGNGNDSPGLEEKSDAELQKAAAALLLSRAVSKHVVRDIENPEVLVGGQDHKGEGAAFHLTSPRQSLSSLRSRSRAGGPTSLGSTDEAEALLATGSLRRPPVTSGVPSRRMNESTTGPMPSRSIKGQGSFSVSVPLDAPSPRSVLMPQHGWGRDIETPTLGSPISKRGRIWRDADFDPKDPASAAALSIAAAAAAAAAAATAGAPSFIAASPQGASFHLNHQSSLPVNWQVGSGGIGNSSGGSVILRSAPPTSTTAGGTGMGNVVIHNGVAVGSSGNPVMISTSTPNEQRTPPTDNRLLMNPRSPSPLPSPTSLRRPNSNVFPPSSATAYGAPAAAMAAMAAATTSVPTSGSPTPYVPSTSSPVPPTLLSPSVSLRMNSKRTTGTGIFIGNINNAFGGEMGPGVASQTTMAAGVPPMIGGMVVSGSAINLGPGPDHHRRHTSIGRMHISSSSLMESTNSLSGGSGGGGISIVTSVDGQDGSPPQSSHQQRRRSSDAPLNLSLPMNNTAARAGSPPPPLSPTNSGSSGNQAMSPRGGNVRKKNRFTNTIRFDSSFNSLLKSGAPGTGAATAAGGPPPVALVSQSSDFTPPNPSPMSRLPTGSSLTGATPAILAINVTEATVTSSTTSSLATSAVAPAGISGPPTPPTGTPSATASAGGTPPSATTTTATTTVAASSSTSPAVTSTTAAATAALSAAMPLPMPTMMSRTYSDPAHNERRSSITETLAVAQRRGSPSLAERALARAAGAPLDDRRPLIGGNDKRGSGILGGDWKRMSGGGALLAQATGGAIIANTGSTAGNSASAHELVRSPSPASRVRSPSPGGMDERSRQRVLVIDQAVVSQRLAMYVT